MKTSIQTLRHDEQGFTLVELAVVMIIIGLLIGGILKGQELITNARVTTTASQIEAMGAAYNGFRDQFNAIPGDMGNATNRIANCTNACQNGDDNGVINVGVGAGVTAGEGVGFFGQLLSANFITGMTGDDNGANAAFGITNPVAPIGGGFKVGDPRGGAGLVGGFTGQTLGPSPYIVLAGITIVSDVNTGPLSNTQAANIDRRLDDGTPTTGTVIADTGCDDTATPPLYDEDNAANACSIAYRLQ